MKYIPLIILASLTSSIMANEQDWVSNSWEAQSFEENEAFNRSKIKSRASKEYDDRLYKYITGDYHAQNNHIELASIHLDDSLQNDEVEINIMVDNLKVMGNSYKDGISIKKNNYKNFVNNDDESIDFFQDSNPYQGEITTEVELENSQNQEVLDTDISEIEPIYLEDKKDIKEIYLLIEDATIIVD